MKKAVANFDEDARKNYLDALREAEESGDKDFYTSLIESICLQGNEDNVAAAKYVLNNYDAIRIYHTDPDASKGGATEPHVSHILSNRLSSRPMGWSKGTLKHLAPILAAGRATLIAPENQSEETDKSEYKPFVKPKKKKYIPNSLGLPDPDIAVFPRTRTGHRPYALNLLT